MIKTEQECLDCFRNQIRRTALLQGCSTDNVQEILLGVDKIIDPVPPGCSPPEIAGMVYRFLSEQTGVIDPYAKIKTQSTQQMLDKYSYFKDLVVNSEDPLKQAIFFAGMGNAIDYGADPNFNLQDKEFFEPGNPRPCV